MNYRLVSLLFVIALYSFNLHAAILYVDKGATGNGDGTSWANAFTELQEAIDSAAVGDRIWVAAATYYPTRDRFGNTAPSDPRELLFELKDGVKMYGGFTGVETMLGERDPDLNATILSGDIGVFNDSTDNCYIVVLGENLTEGTVFDGFRVRKANATGSYFNPFTFTYTEAGAMHIEDSRLIIRNTRFSRNTEGDGAGLHSKQSQLRIVRCAFFNNTGSSVFRSDNISTDTICNSVFSFNDAPAMDVDDTYIFNCTLYANEYGVLLKGETRLYNSIVAQSTLQDVLDNGASPAIYDVQNCILSDGVQNLRIFQNIHVGNPRLVEPDSLDFAPLSCSPAVNGGADALAVFPNVPDFLGQPRKFGSSVDIGAIELQSSSSSVNEVVIYVDSSATGANNGTSWANAYTSLVDAAADANALADCDRAQIRVAQGTYYVSTTDDPGDFITFNAPVQVFGGFPTGGGTQGSRDWEAQRTVISGDIGAPGDPADNSHQLLRFAVLDSTCQFNGFHFEDVTLGDNDVAIEFYDCFSFVFKNIRCQGVHSTGADFVRIIGVEESSIDFEDIILTQLNGASLYPIYAENPYTSLEVPYGIQELTFANCRFDSNACRIIVQLNHERATFINTDLSENNADILDQRFLGSDQSSLVSFFDCKLFDNACVKCFDIDSLLLNHCLIANQISTPPSQELIGVNDLLTLQGTTIFDHSEILIDKDFRADVVLQNSILSGLYETEFSDDFNPLSDFSFENSMTRFKYEGQINWIEGPARYRDIADRDFTLRDCSPGKNMANASLYAIPPTDIYGNTRQVGVLDIGAAENQTAEVTPTTQVNLFVDSSATAAGNGTSWFDANPSLWDATFRISLSEQCFDVDTVFVARGTYYPDSTYADLPLTLVQDLVLIGGYPSGGGERDIEQNPVVLSADIGVPGDLSDNTTTILKSIGQSEESVIDGLTFSDSQLDVDNLLDHAVVNTFDSEALFINCKWSGNGAQDSNANMVIYNRLIPSFESCAFTNNHIYYGITTFELSPDTIKLNNCLFKDNSILLGGCIDVIDPIVIKGCHFHNNVADNASIVELRDGKISNSKFIENVVSNADDDHGVVYSYAGDVTVENSFFIGNSTDSLGGALTFEIGDFFVYNNLFAGNSASNGGALYVAKPSPTATTTVEVINCTFDQNSAGAGANIYLLDANLDAYNTILWGSGPTLGWSGSPIIDFDHNVYSDVSLSVPSGNVGSNNLFAVDPLFLAPIDIDGPDDILGTIDDGLQVQKSSPVKDAGENSYANAVIDRDLARRIRKYYDNVDIGAYELICDNTAQNLHFATDPGALPTGVSWQSAAGDIATTLGDFIAEGCLVDSIKLAEGTFTVSTNNDRYDLISLPSGSTLIGGYNVVNNMEMGRDPELFPTVISGDLGSSQSSDDNSFRLVTFEDYLDTTKVIGLQLIEAVDSLGSALYAPSLPGNGPVFIDQVMIGNHISPASVLNETRMFLRNVSFQGNESVNGRRRGILNRGDLLMEDIIFHIGEDPLDPDDRAVINRETGLLRIRGGVGIERVQDP